MAEGKSGVSPVLLIGGAAAAWYFWPQISAALGLSTATPAAVSTLPIAPAGTQLTNSTSITAATPGAVAIGNGCYQYNNMVGCPPGVTPPAGAPPISNCTPGFEVNANGVCAPVVAAGTAPGGPATFTPFRNRLASIGRLAAALPVTNNTLIQASHDPATAAVLGNDPRNMLTVEQWNYFYTQAAGIVQADLQHPLGEPGARVNAATYQRMRAAAGLPVRLGTVRRSAPGMFPLGTISNGPDRVPYVTPGNRTIYRVAGRGSVVSGLGLIASGGGNHRWGRSPFPRPVDWRRAE